MISPAVPILQEHMRLSIAAWLGDPATEDVAINRPGEMCRYTDGRWERSSCSLSLDDIQDICVLAGAAIQQDVGSDNPLISAELPTLTWGEDDSSNDTPGRFQGCLAPATRRGFGAITIRKHDHRIHPTSEIKHRYQIGEWSKWTGKRRQRSFRQVLEIYDAFQITPSPEIFTALIESAARNRLGVLFVGGTGTGKTTFGKTFINAIDENDRIIIIEEVYELAVAQWNVVHLQFSPDGQSAANLSSERCVRASMRMRPHRILLGELRDNAAYSYMRAMLAHPGSATTVHGHDSASGFRQYYSLIRSSPEAAAFGNEMIELAADSVDLIIPLHREDSILPVVGEVWFAGAALRDRNQTAAELLRAA